MTAIDDGVGWKFGNDVMETVHDILITATIEISTSNAHTEEGIACKGNALFFIIKGDTTWRMTWGLQDLKDVISETDLLVVAEKMTHLRIMTMQGDANHRLELFRQIVDEKGIVGRDLHHQSVDLEKEIIAEVMVEVPMGSQQVDRLELLGVDILADGLTLFVVIGAAVDDHTLAGLIAHHVGVLLQLVAFERLNGNHCF